MLDSLITSKTRLKLLMKFFINCNTSAYLRGLTNELGESTNSIRQELVRLESIKLIKSETAHNKKLYSANTLHPYFNDIHHLMLVYVGIEQIVEELVKSIYRLEKAYITNSFAEGIPGNIIDLVLVGSDFDDIYINQLVRRTEANVSLKIRYITVKPDELSKYINDRTKSLLIWSAN